MDTVSGTALAPGGHLVIQTVHPWIACGELPYVDGWREERFAAFGEDTWKPMPWYFRTFNAWLKTLRDAVLLVAAVVLLFLRNWRSALIPLVAVPVAVVGTFAAMAALDFSLNNLTLFGLVLAIGIVVDDAIVVVEAVEHHMERGLSPREPSVAGCPPGVSRRRRRQGSGHPCPA